MGSPEQDHDRTNLLALSFEFALEILNREEECRKVVPDINIGLTHTQWIKEKERFSKFLRYLMGHIIKLKQSG